MSPEEALETLDNIMRAVARTTNDKEGETLFALADLRTRLLCDYEFERARKSPEELARCRIELGVAVRYVYEHEDGRVENVVDLVGPERRPLEGASLLASCGKPANSDGHALAPVEKLNSRAS